MKTGPADRHTESAGGTVWRSGAGVPARADHAPWYLECKAEDRVYIARFNPGRILAECAAKRQMLANVPLVTDIPSEVGGTSECVLMCMAAPALCSGHPPLSRAAGTMQAWGSPETHSEGTP